MTTSRIFLALLVSLAGSCMSDVESENAAALEEDLTNVTNIDFTSYAQGPLGSPWTVNTASGGTLSVVSTPDHGNALRAHFENYSALSAETAMIGNGPNLDFQFDVKAGSSTAFVLEIKGTRAGGSYGSTRTLHFNFVPGGDFSDDYTGVCGTIAVNAWSHVRLVFHTDTPNKTYDAWVNGASACTNRPFSSTFGFPTKSFDVMNSNLYVFKGDILFDNFKVSTP
jgi:hypothetical protein